MLLVVAGGIEYSLLRGAILSSRGQSLRATFNDGRAVLLAAERSRLRAGRAPLPDSTLALNLVKVMADAGVTAAVFSPSLKEVASAGPGTASGVETGVTVPTQSQSDLLAAAQYDTVIAPNLYGSGSNTSLVMVIPLTGRLGRPLGARLGAIELAEPAGPIQSELGSAATVLGVGGAVVLLIALLIGLWLTARGLGPLSQLTAAAQSLGRGDLSRRIDLKPRGNEVGKLARVFDEMAGNVEQTVKERAAAEQRMRQFIGDASHELRTPLTAIKGYLDVLQRGAGASPDVVQAALPVMSQEAERMRALVMDLLTLARADAERRVELRPVDLGAFLEHFLDARHPAGPLKLELQPGLTALADPDALATIAGNLQSNAERHGLGKEITWSTISQSGLVGLRCADQGPGIAPQDLPHVFERFFRASGSRSRKDGGSGLGLAIVQSLAETQAGRVSVNSTPGRGAQFTVLLQPANATTWKPAQPLV